MRFSLFFIFILSPFLIQLSAQEKIQITGKITDQNNKPIQQALVSIQGTKYVTYTDEKGQYSLGISEGKYILSISAFGFKTKLTPIEIWHNLQLSYKLQEQSVDLSTVEVLGKTKSQQLREGSLTVSSLDIKNQASSLNNLTSTIGRSTGIRIRENGGVGSDFDLSINGLAGNSVRYFIDGVPLSSIGNGVSIANLPINIVDRIDVYRGVVPTLLGTDALGGAINIITKKDKKDYLDISYGMGSFNTYKTDLNAQYIDKKTGIFIRPSVGVNFSKNDYMMKDVEVWDAEVSEFKKTNEKRFHNDYLSILSQISIGVTDKKWADLFSLSSSFSSVDKELQTGATQSIVYGKAKRKNKSYNISSQYVKHNLFIDNLSTDLYLSHTWDNTTVIDTAYRKYRWDGTYTLTSRNEITGRAKSIRHIKRPLSVIRANLNYKLNENHSFNFNYLLENVSNKRYDELDIEFAPSKDRFSKHFLGFSYNQEFWDDRLSNTFFVKDYISHLKIEQQDLYWITGSNTENKSTTSNYWGYGLSSRFRIYSWLALKASYEHTARLPLANEVLGNGTTVYANLALKPENSNNINMGLFGSINIGAKHRISYEADFFYRSVKDYIRLVVTESEGMSQYNNVSSVKVKGIEGEIRYDYDNLLQFVGNISYVDEKNKNKYQANGKPEITYNNRIPNKPWLYSNLEVNIRKKNILGSKDNQIKLAYYFQYVHWFYLTWEGYGTLSSKSTIPTQCLNSASLTYSIKKDKYNVSLECNNIFDRLIYDNYMMQKPGRAFFCKFRVFIN